MTKVRAWKVPAIVVSVVDGDSFHAQLELGWNVSIRAMIRVEGVNAPELNTRAGKGAKTFLAALLPPQTRILIESKRLDKYGRTQAIVTLPDGSSVANHLLRAGHAVPLTGY